MTTLSSYALPGQDQGHDEARRLAHRMLAPPRPGLFRRQSKYDDHLYIVSNAGCADKDLAHLNKHLAEFKAKGRDVSLEVLSGQSLLAIQGPAAAPALVRFEGWSPF